MMIARKAKVASLQKKITRLQAERVEKNKTISQLRKALEELMQEVRSIDGWTGDPDLVGPIERAQAALLAGRK